MKDYKRRDLHASHTQDWGDIELAGYLANEVGPVSSVLDLYHTDYNNNPPDSVSFMSPFLSTSGRLHSEFVRLLFLQTHRETDHFLQFQEFSLSNPPVDYSTSDSRFSINSSKTGLSCLSIRRQFYVLLLT